jgi:hypothetical protein
MHVLPLSVSDVLPLWRGRRLCGVAVGPLIPNEVIVLLRPHHARECLSLDVSQIFVNGKRADTVVEVVCFVFSPFYDVVELLLVQIRIVLLRNAEADDCMRLDMLKTTAQGCLCQLACAFPRSDAAIFVEAEPSGALGSHSSRIYGVFLAVDDIAMERIFYIRLWVLLAVQMLKVGVIFGIDKLWEYVLAAVANAGRW